MSEQASMTQSADGWALPDAAPGVRALPAQTLSERGAAGAGSAGEGAAGAGAAGAGSSQHRAWGQRWRGLWESYRRSLKPLAVEEPIDVWVHRPLAYLVARALLPTPVSPNAVTMASIVFGLVAGACFIADFQNHLQVGALCLFGSTVLDCADGQLARLRRASSAFGRMLDGCADLVVTTAAVGGSAWVLLERCETWWQRLSTLLLVVLTVVTGSFHTTMYDHYKNVYLRLTSAGYREGEDYETALERRAAGRSRRATGDLPPEGWTERLMWAVYLFYVRSQQEYVQGFDPAMPRLGLLPEYAPQAAGAYAARVSGMMRVWRTWMGFGSLVFGLTVASFFDVLEGYLLFRLVALNALFFGYLRPAQRVVSREAFSELERLSAPASVEVASAALGV